MEGLTSEKGANDCIAARRRILLKGMGGLPLRFYSAHHELHQTKTKHFRGTVGCRCSGEKLTTEVTINFERLHVAPQTRPTCVSEDISVYLPSLGRSFILIRRRLSVVPFGTTHPTNYESPHQETPISIMSGQIVVLSGIQAKHTYLYALNC